jgi:FkbM family methyltransferase
MYNQYFGIENILDIGANFGYHSLFFSKEVKGKVFAFEPQIQNFQLLQNNIKLNSIENIIPFNVACGETHDTVKIDLITKKESINMGDFTPNELRNVYHSITQSIPVDFFHFTDIDLIKIDVQGWEKKVLLGCKNLLQRCKPILIIEFEHFQLQKTNTTCLELFEFIKDNGYHVFYLEYIYPSDHICVHNDKLDDFRNIYKEYISDHIIDNDINNNKNFITEKIKV